MNLEISRLILRILVFMMNTLILCQNGNVTKEQIDYMLFLEKQAGKIIYG